MNTLKQIYKNIISELFVHGNKKTAKYLVAYRENVWLFDNETIPVDFRKQMENKIGFNEIIETFNDVTQEAEKDPEIICGTIENNSLTLISNRKFST